MLVQLLGIVLLQQLVIQLVILVKRLGLGFLVIIKQYVQQFQQLLVLPLPAPRASVHFQAACAILYRRRLAAPAGMTSESESEIMAGLKDTARRNEVAEDLLGLETQASAAIDQLMPSRITCST